MWHRRRANVFHHLIHAKYKTISHTENAHNTFIYFFFFPFVFVCWIFEFISLHCILYARALDEHAQTHAYSKSNNKIMINHYTPRAESVNWSIRLSVCPCPMSVNVMDSKHSLSHSSVHTDYRQYVVYMQCTLNDDNNNNIMIIALCTSYTLCTLK